MKDASTVSASFIFTPDTTKKALYDWGCGAELRAYGPQNGRAINCSPSDHNHNRISIRFPLGQIQRAPVQVTALSQRAPVTSSTAGATSSTSARACVLQAVTKTETLCSITLPDQACLVGPSHFAVPKCTNPQSSI